MFFICCATVKPARFWTLLSGRRLYCVQGSRLNTTTYVKRTLNSSVNPDDNKRLNKNKLKSSHADGFGCLRMRYVCCQSETCWSEWKVVCGVSRIIATVTQDVSQMSLWTVFTGTVSCWICNIMHRDTTHFDIRYTDFKSHSVTGFCLLLVFNSENMTNNKPTIMNYYPALLTLMILLLFHVRVHMHTTITTYCYVSSCTWRQHWQTGNISVIIDTS